MYVSDLGCYSRLPRGTMLHSRELVDMVAGLMLEHSMSRPNMCFAAHHPLMRGGSRMFPIHHAVVPSVHVSMAWITWPSCVYRQRLIVAQAGARQMRAKGRRGFIWHVIPE